MSDLENPSFSLASGETNTVSITGTLTKESSTDPDANSLSATATGIFESKLLGAESETNTYTINVTSKDSQNQDEFLFFHATSDPKVAHNIIDGESFIYRVFPSDKNITVWDPDDRILIDTNLDGKYETNILSWTAGEIHFKINPNPNGTTPYEFFASQCRSLTFVHRNINKDSSSSYSGFIETINYNLNTDSDSSFKYDYLDLDSDDDTCNDLSEAGFGDKDPDGDGIMGEGQATYDNGKIDSRGKYKDPPTLILLKILTAYFTYFKNLAPQFQ